jgi:hypothetical protein
VIGLQNSVGIAGELRAGGVGGWIFWRATFPSQGLSQQSAAFPPLAWQTEAHFSRREPIEKVLESESDMRLTGQSQQLIDG